MLQHRTWAHGGAVQVKHCLPESAGRRSRTGTHGQPGSELGAGGALCPTDAEEPGAVEDEAD